MKSGRTALRYLLILCLLLGVLLLYTRSEFLVTLANQVWLCL